MNSLETHAPPVCAPPRPGRRPTPGVAAVALTAVACGLAFTNLLPAGLRAAATLAPLAALLAAGTTRAVRSVVVHAGVVAVCAVFASVTGAGVFALDPAARVIAAAGLLAAGAAALMLARTRAERDAARADAADAADHQALLHGTPAMMCRYTADGALTFANESLCRFLGLTRQQLVGRSVLEFLTDLPRLDAVSEVQATIGAGQPISHLGPFRRADGAERWHRWMARAVLRPDGSVAEYHAVGVDITDRRRADEERREIERKMLEGQRLESLGVLAGGVAHGFNNLFARILGHAELAAAAAPPNSPLHPHIDVIVGGVKEAGGLTRQLLAYSGKGRVFVTPVRLDDIVRKMVPLLQVSLPKLAALQVNRSDELPAVAADESQLRQVLVNLVTNAGEAIGEKPGTVTVSTSARHVSEYETPASYLFDPLRSGEYVLLRVTDTGCGMDEATLARMFDPFFSTKFAGRGLGMPAVLGIVRAHRGGVRVLSSPGGGTTVTVYLPATDAEPVSVETPSTISMPPRPAAPPVPGRVLVVDDEDSVRRVAELMLEQLGYAVTTACDGQEAVDLFTAEPASFRAILLDLTMPRMDGAEALAVIRELDVRVPVVLCSGFSEDAIPEHLSKAGVTGFLQKPYTLTDLERQIRRAVGG